MDAAYLAGIIDGEGSIDIYASSEQMLARVSVGNTYLPLLEEIQKHYGGMLCRNKSNKSNRVKPFYQLEWRGNKRIRPLLEAVLPYLIVKRAQAEFVLQNWVPSFQGSGYRLTQEQKEKRQDMKITLQQMKQYKFYEGVQ